jgi:hypothetical protein
MLTKLRKLIATALFGDPVKIAAFREADAALQADYQRRLDNDGPWGEDETYLRLNGRVNDLWHTVPPWRRR